MIISLRSSATITRHRATNQFTLVFLIDCLSRPFLNQRGQRLARVSVVTQQQVATKLLNLQQQLQQTIRYNMYEYL